MTPDKEIEIHLTEDESKAKEKQQPSTSVSKHQTAPPSGLKQINQTTKSVRAVGGQYTPTPKPEPKSGAMKLTQAVIVPPSIEPIPVPPRRLTLHEAAEEKRYERMLQDINREEQEMAFPKHTVGDDWNQEIEEEPSTSFRIPTAGRLPKNLRKEGVQGRVPEFLHSDRPKPTLSATITRPPEQDEPEFLSPSLESSEPQEERYIVPNSQAQTDHL